MNWDEIIERNVERLVAVLTELFVMAGFGRGGTAFLPRSVCRALLILLRPAESAGRVPAFCLIDPLKRFAPEGFEWEQD